MNMGPLVSVIVPVYNAEKSLSRCVQSIQIQSYQNLEIILVDDGSTDHSVDICDAFAAHDLRIHVVHQKNCGVSYARNTGISMATGDYICFVDSDDWVDVSHISNFLCHAEGIDCVIMGYCKETNSGSFLCQLKSGLYSTNNLNYASLQPLFAEGYIHPCWNKLYRRTLLQQFAILFPVDFHISEDSIFCLNYLLHCSNFVLTNASSYHYVIESLKPGLSKKVYPNIFDIYEQVYMLLDKLLTHGGCEGILKLNILSSTIYPQILASVIKVIHSENISEKKLSILHNMKKKPYCFSVLNRSILLSQNYVEKIMLILTRLGCFRLLGVLLKCLRLKK